ncbi:hypothetical protein IFM89_019320 [Coptis chinensis]|uniref:F-box domain-containing protein n=1 Tax=Coptis chinensis TaxID=261450 RepID=A0A835LZZ6_9MAGN|nr:hypothetical protein IFM89_019320 [Coptis chinensis]
MEKSMKVACLKNRLEVVPDHVLELVIERLCLPDLYRFGVVSKHCKSVCDPLQFSDHLPWLIVPFINNINNSTPTSSMAFDDTKDVGFFSLRDGKVYKAELPELSNRRICGSFPGGWLMTVHENSQVQLFNPLRSSSRIIHLPPLTNFPGVVDTIERNEDGVSSRFYMVSVCSRDVLRSSKFMRDTYIIKVAMSSSLVSEGTIIMAIQATNQTLAFYRIGGDQRVWTPIARAVGHGMLHDLTYYNGKFYAVHNGGCVFIVNGLEETRDTSTSLEKIIHCPPGDIATQHYVVESSDDLLVVRRNVSPFPLIMGHGGISLEPTFIPPTTKFLNPRLIIEFPLSSLARIREEPL